MPKAKADSTEFLTTRAVSRLLDVSDETVRVMARTGRLPFVQTYQGVQRLFKLSDVERVAAARGKNSAPAE